MKRALIVVITTQRAQTPSEAISVHVSMDLLETEENAKVCVEVFIDLLELAQKRMPRY